MAVVLLALVPGGTKLGAQPAPEVRPGWTFTPSLALGGTVDDNVLLVGDESQTLLPTEYITAITPAGTLDYRARRVRFGSSYRGSFVLYRELSELNSLDQSARAHLTYDATRYVTLDLGQAFSTARTTDVLEFVGVPFSRVGSRNSLTTAGIRARVSPRTTLNGAYNLRIVDFEDEAQDRISFPGGHEHHVSGALDYQLNTRASLGATYSHRRVLVRDEPQAIAVHHAAATTRYRLSEFVDLDGSVGISRLDAVLGEPARTGLAWSGGVSARWEHVTATARYQRSILPSFGFGGTFQNEELVGSLRGAFARRRGYWHASAAWRENDPLVLGDTGRRTLWLTPTVGYRLAPWLDVEGYYAHARQDSQQPGGLVHRNRFGFRIVTSRPLRIVD